MDDTLDPTMDYLLRFTHKDGRTLYARVGKGVQFNAHKETATPMRHAKALAVLEVLNAKPQLQGTFSLVAVPAKPRPSYRAAIEWIATSDDLGLEDSAWPNDLETIRSVPSVHAVAAAFDLDPLRVARDVLAYREKHS